MEEQNNILIQETKLLKAAEVGDNNTLTELLQTISPNVHNASHFTPLILASHSGSIINTLIKQ